MGVSMMATLKLINHGEVSFCDIEIIRGLKTPISSIKAF